MISRLRAWILIAGLVLIPGTVMAALWALDAQARDFATLTGDRQKGTVTLVWTVDRWPEGLVGFVVRRRKLDDNGKPQGEWQDVTRGTISPAAGNDVDLSKVVAQDQERVRLALKRAKLLESKRLKTFGTADFLARVRQPAKGLFTALEIQLLSDPDLALLSGFGCTDTIEASVEMSYGLFAVYRESGTGKQPIATYRATTKADARLTTRDLTAVRVAGGVLLTWSLPAEVVRAHSVTGFRVYRSSGQPAAFENLVPTGIGSGTTRAGKRVWTYLDRDAARERSYDYAVVPLHALGRELPGRVEVTAKREAPGFRAPAPKVVEAKRDGDGVRIRWEFPIGQQRNITAFRVERAQFDEGTFEPISHEPIDPSARSVVDASRRETGKAYVYRVIAVRGNTAVAVSDAELFMTLDAPVPPKPTGLASSLVLVDGKPRVRLTWNARKPDDSVTDGYVLYADHPHKGKLRRLASIPVIHGTEYYLALDILTGREFTIGLAAIAKNGQESARVTTRAFVPGSLPPDVGALRALREQTNGPIVLRWTYPELPHLLGFRVYDGNTLIANETVVGAAARSFEVTEVDPKSNFVFHVRAVASGQRVSRTARVVFTPRVASKPRRPAPPANLTATRGTDTERKLIRLVWDDVASVDHYEWATDSETMDRFPDPVPVPDNARGRYRFEVDDPTRTLTVRLWAAAAGGAKSFYSQVQVLGEGRTLPPALLRRYDLEKQEDGYHAVWSWKYRHVEGLRGFRIYRDGGEQPVVDESKLDAGARSWTSGVIPRKKRVTFAIEAIGGGDVVSERGPAKTVLHFRR